LAEPSEQTAPEQPPVGGLDDVTLDVRFAGYCVYCDRIVERQIDGTCPEGHPAEAMSGRIPLIEGEALPTLPRFNLAAFLLPPIWGPAHGQWAGAIFLPIWLFMDSIIASAGRGGVVTMIAATVVVACTLAFEAFFAIRANGLAYRRVCDRMTVDEYIASQRMWYYVSVPVAAALIGWSIWFHVAFDAAARL